MLPSRLSSPFIYNGLRFRSRLEAQWACYFDHLGIDYAYEAKTFRLKCDPHGTTHYTPDFYLPSLNVHLEVKPECPNIRASERVKADALAQHLNTGRVWLSHGTAPWFEQLPAPDCPAIPKAMLTHDASKPRNPSAFWIIDARYITLNKSFEKANDLTPPERLPALTNDITEFPAHPLASPILRTAVQVSRNLKLSDVSGVSLLRSPTLPAQRQHARDHFLFQNQRVLKELA